jgi:hypothetical protein
MNVETAKQMVGQVVQDKMGGEIFGILEYVTADGWAGVRGPFKRLDEIQVSRLELDPT